MNPTATRWQKLLADTRAAWPPGRYRDVGVVVGVSGGADSIALLRVLSELQTDIGDPTTSRSSRPTGFLIAAHFHHGLRGQDSDDDQQFVQEVAGQLEVEFVTKRAETICHDEATMSAHRMDFMVETAKKSGARYLALAHSRDDNVETVLHHLMRGTGPSGLCGIGSPRNVGEDLVLVRPFLSVARESIREALREVGQPWREDRSNESSQYSRNWIRNELLPMIQSRYPDAIDAVTRAIDGQRQWRQTISRLAEEWFDQHDLGHDSGLSGLNGTAAHDPPPIVLARSAEIDPAVTIAALQNLWLRRDWPRGAMSRQHWLRLTESLQRGPDHRYELPGKIDVRAAGNRVTLTQITSHSPD